jgi:hypothetical protein
MIKFSTEPRRCSWCDDPMPWYSKLFFFHTCKHCAYRMSMGTSPRQRPDPNESKETTE